MRLVILTLDVTLLARASMVLTFGIKLPQYPTNARSLSILRFSLTKVVASLRTMAFSYGLSGCAELSFIQVKELSMCGIRKRLDWSLKSNADGRELDPLTESGDGRTRLLKTIKRLQMRLNERIKEVRKDLPRKLMFFLVGFYCATAFATFIGQTVLRYHEFNSKTLVRSLTYLSITQLKCALKWCKFLQQVKILDLDGKAVQICKVKRASDSNNRRAGNLKSSGTS